MTTREDAIQLAREVWCPEINLPEQIEYCDSVADKLERFYIRAQNEALRKAAKEVTHESALRVVDDVAYPVFGRTLVKVILALVKDE